MKTTFTSIIFTILISFLFSQTSYSQCTAAFSWDDTNQTIQFFDESTVAPGDQIISWFWDFDDDGATSTQQNPIHTFSEIDKFDVELTITTANGCTSTIEIRIEICNFMLNVTVGSCNSNNEVPITINVIDVFDNADEIDILLDGQVLPGGPYEIDGQNPVNVTVLVFGDGLQHVLTVQSTDIETCNESYSFTIPDCTSNCFLGSMNVQFSGGTSHTIQVGDDFFSPVNTTIVVGDLVVFDWIGSGHSTTSDATTGPDSWNSGVIGAGSTFNLSITNPAVHPYYCIPHGGPGGSGMAGSIVANCPPSGNFSLIINFNTTIANAAGYDVLIDGVVQPGSPHTYNGTGAQSVTASLSGDGQTHVIQIRDVADPTCFAERNFLAPDCGSAPSCSISVTAIENGGCTANDEVPVELTVNSINGGANGFNVTVDGASAGSFPYDPSGVTVVTVNVLGNGQSHNIVVTDVVDGTCTGSVSIITTNCTIPCMISNLSASSGNSVTHTVFVEDFVFNPANITITSGDIIEWDWTGQIAHTSTSDATTGADSWDSGLLNTGATYQSPVLSAGVHPYYCIPHGAPGGVGMAGAITVQANCTNGEVSVAVSFTELGGGFNGFNILVDGVITPNSPFLYDPSGNNTASVNVVGDGQSHSIEVRDVDDATCTSTINFTTPNCNAPTCQLTMSAVENGSCDPNDNVPVDLTINDVGGGASGFTVSVDGNNIGTYSYSGTGTTNVTINVIGDGQNHNITITDIDEATCTASFSLTTTNCTIPCVLSNLSASTGSSTTHIVGVEDFVFNPANITITAGDIIEWDWTGQIAHTTTSDATTGTDSWDSGLLNTGATYQSPVLSAGVHPYYCIPHGAPGGVGMAGTVTVQANCTNGEVSVNVTFNETGGSFNGYNIYVDGVLTGNSPMTYDPSGNNSFSVNVIGDGNSHSIEIKDVDDPTCSILTNLTTPNCNAPTCQLTMSAVENGSCDPNDNVPVDLTVNDVGGGVSGFTVSVDGNNVGTYSYSGTGTTNVTINVIGDGQNHNITITDIDETTCTASASLTTTNCMIPCVLSNLLASTGSSTTHIVGVEDFVFNPANITITAGDIIEWDWTGQIAHTTTSDATTGADSWDSGLLNTGATYQSPVLSAGVHPYYCIPHGAPDGVGMAGTITVQANCTNGEVSVNVSFNETGGSFNGYNIYVDGVLTGNSPMTYDPSGNNSFSVNVIGDGNSHSIEIKDVDDPTCSILTNLTTPNCNAPTCQLTMSAVENGSCDPNDNVPVDVTVNDVGGGASGFTVSVDGNNVGTYSYSGTGTTNVTINVIGDGQNHNITITDIDEATCTASTSLTTTNCMIPCVLSNLNASTGSSTTHIVGVEDFVFNPANITITAGDIIEWDWTGQIAHTTTSDATTGTDSWDSGLLNTGATYQSPVLSAGVHPYYCIPHGAPGGVGMAGTVTVQANCTNGEVSVNVTFNETGGSFNGFNIYVDGVLTGNSPMTYDPSGTNSFSVNVIGDGNSHSIEIKDVDDPTCSILTNLTTPNCNAPTCQLTMSAVENGSCDPNDNVPVDVTINDVGGGASGFTVSVDGNNVGTYSYSGTGTTNVTINVIGDGQNHNITITDIDETTCAASASLTTTNCMIPCVLSNLNASTGSSTTHIVGVEDFVFNPANITITAGDIIEWDWTGAIAHTSTSDATTGADSWDSGLLNTGATYQSPVLSAGVHPYYCIPHGAPGGVGMAGTITVQANCTNGEVSVNVSFNETGGSFNGYNIYVDGVLTNSPMTYDPSGNNSFSVNVIGDGNSHSIEIKDVDDPTCSILTNLTTPNCNAPTCNLAMSALENGSCDPNDNVPVDVTVNDVGGGASGFTVSVDGNNVGTYSYSGTGTTVVTINVIGDGQNHNITITDIDETTCTTSASLTTTNCMIPCVLSNLNASTGSSTTHVVGVEDFVFNPANITITAGDIIEWDWTGAIAHTTTSDATTGADSWDSGLLNTGATYQSPVLSAGVHPYYCIPHGAPGGTGMAGTITVQANCTNGEVSVNVSFNETGGSFNGFNIYVDGVLTNSPMTYDPSGNNSFSVNVIGDGNSHSIEIKDVDDPTCSILTNLTTPNCNAPTCQLTMSAVENGSCDPNDNVPVDLTINDVGGGASGFTVSVDGNNVGTFAYSGTGTTNVTINVIGDGQNHNITITDIDEATCTASASLTTTNCTIPCVLSNLNVSTGSSTTHIVGVEDFVFNPANITITAGDIIEWDWTGQIAHTTTSDATTGADSWDSGLLNTGATYQSPVLSAGVHPYYCIPHGAPGGTGMAGTITVQANCTNGEVSVNVTFNETGGSFNGYNIYVDGVLTGNSPMTYDPSGTNSFSVNVIGDGNSHSIEIKDVDDPTCSILTNLTTPNCNAPTCQLTMSAVENGSCDPNDNVPVDLTINDVGGGASGFTVSVDGNNVGTFAYSGTGTTNVTINVIGDGQNHNITITDIDEATCTASTSLTTTNCMIPCVLSNLNASTGSSTTHTVNVEDFVFTPHNISITAGDIVQWNWTGVIDHTATSDAPSGVDSWDSGLLNTGATYQSPVLSAGVHPYYCIPHGTPNGGGMSGTITVQTNCTNGEVSVNVNFNETGGSFNGFNIFVDGVLTPSSPMSYDPSGNNSFSINIIGDGNSHDIEIKDVDDPTCSIFTNITTPDCNASTCNLTLSAVQSGNCDPNNNVPVDLTINDTGGGASGFNVFVEGNNVGTFSYSGTGTTNVTISVEGNGLNNNITVQDIEDSTCTSSVLIPMPSCTTLCDLSNLSVNSGNQTIHIVEVEDFVFNPANIIISEGDIIQWVWTGGIAHTATSDATSGSYSWDSGLLNTGDIYQSPPLTAGVHPYYCIPHGAPNGVGMAGTITVQADCTNGEVAVNILFDETGGSFSGYNVFVDGSITASSPMSYDPSGSNSFFVNVIGDGNLHSIEIKDVEDSACSTSTNITTPNCNPPICGIEINSVNNSGVCNPQGINPIDVTFNVNDVGINGYNLIIDGQLVSTQVYNNTAGQNSHLLFIEGDGQLHTVVIQDVDYPFCSDTISVTTILCPSNCELSNLVVENISGNNPATHIVEVIDFDFSPKDIAVSVGDIVRFEWTGTIPHTTTSDATTGNDVWDSGLLGQGAIYEVTIQEEGFHPYYCIPHGTPGGIGMVGTITATPPCNNGEVAINISFDEIDGGNLGYNIYIDGNLEIGSPYSYHPSGNNSLVINLQGDGQSHLIEIQDVDEGTCSISQNIQVPNCNISNPCSLEMTATEIMGCDVDNNVTYELSIISQNSSSQFNILVDGNLYAGSPFTYDPSGNTTTNISINGTGQNRIISIQDVDSISCTAMVEVLTPQCGAPCEILNLEVGGNQPTKHTVEVLDFEFFPKDIEVVVGDTVEFIWTGVIPHTATSDATTGNTVFDSGLLGQGATYQVVITESGFHPYYCIPHGGPNGIGMAGTITALEPCINGDALVSINFEVTNGSSLGYNVFLDGQQIAGPLPYDNPVGSNSVVLPILGDGMEHTLTIQDMDVSFCAASVNFTTPVCELLCEIQNLSAQSGDSIVHTIVVDDFEFLPQQINARVGETIRFQMIGDIPHTTTSDAPFGINSWDSGLMYLGDTYDVVINSEGTHPYYCVPHGGPGGIGQSGIINTTAECDSNGFVNVAIQFSVTNGTTQGYNIFVNGMLQTGSPFAYDDTLGMNQQTISIIGDGATHFITVQDLETSFCAATTSVDVPDCNAVCEISNPTIAFPQPAKYQVQVEDFEFTPQVIDVLVGDTVEFIWTGAIPHTVTSDATTGNTVFDSGLLGQGTVYQVIVTELNQIPYYCIPHGQPGGIGMSGLIKVNSACNNGIVTANLSFGSVGTSMGYNIYVDGFLEGNSPHAYDPSGNNSVEIMLNGDGNSHAILIEDIDDNTCNNEITFDVPLCPTTCILDIEASAPSACNNDNEVTYDLTIISQNINPTGFNVFINNNLLLGSPFAYNANDTTQLTITLAGDAQNYNIEITDAENSGCSDALNLTTPLCQNFCSIDLSLEQLNGCDNFGNVLFELSVYNMFTGQNGFNVFVDGIPNVNNPYNYSANDTSLVTLIIPGDGLTHEIIVYDVDDITCADTINITTDDCSQNCAIELLEIQQEVPQLHEVEVLDFEFFPKDITVDLGDTVRFFWTGVIPHTVTSDNQTGVDVFNSGLLGQGAVFDVVIENPSFVSYYCIPHGAAGGVGMAGTIEVLDPIDDGILDMTFTFESNSVGVQGYNVFVDNVASNNNTFTYNPSGIHSFEEMIPADGFEHTLRIEDVEFPDCFMDTTFLMPDAQDGCFGYAADFDLTINQQTFEVILTDATTNNPDEWLWTFGDGNTSTLQNPSHLYTQEGDYEICLIATDNDIICSDTICQTISIGIFVCEPNFTYEIDGLTVEFTDASITSQPITNWIYDFGNGLQSVGQQNPSFTFDTLGIYTVCLTIEADTCLADTCMVIDLSDACLTFAPEFSVVQNDMMSVQFTDLSSGTPTNWLWGFGDGNTSNEQNPFHVYDSAGIYNICLLVQDSLNNCNASYCESITIIPTATHDILIQNRDLIIFPNPAQQYISKWTVKGILENDFYQDLDLKIYDVHGRTLKQQIIIGQEQLQVEIPIGLVRGLYMLEIRGERNVYRGKVVVE